MHRIALLTLLLLGLVPAVAQAGTATATVTRDCPGDEKDPACFVAHAADFRAAGGETNDVTVERTADAVLFRDAGAPVTAGAGCTAEGPNAVRCPFDPRPESERRLLSAVSVFAGDGADRVRATVPPLARLDNLLLRGDAGDDTIDSTGVVVDAFTGEGLGATLDGGAGADQLTGGDGGDLLYGGAEADVVRGGAGDDTINGDSSTELPGAGAAGLAGDTVDGGAGSDTISFTEGTAGVRVDLADPGPDGPPGALDTLTAVENVSTEDGGSVVLGDEGPNRIRATGAGADQLDGRGGADEISTFGTDPDVVIGGPGNDRLDTARAQCGDGVDVVTGLDLGTWRLRADCERVVLAGIVADVRAVRVGRRRIVLRVRLDPELDFPRFDGRIAVTHRGRRLGTRRLRLSAPGPRLITIRTRRRAPRGTAVTASFAVDRGRMPAVRLRLP